jgi:hypothetical protein
MKPHWHYRSHASNPMKVLLYCLACNKQFDWLQKVGAVFIIPLYSHGKWSLACDIISEEQVRDLSDFDQIVFKQMLYDSYCLQEMSGLNCIKFTIFVEVRF